MSWDFELVAGPYGGTTEGPAWDGQALLFTDIPNSRIMRYDPVTGDCTEYRTGTNGTNGLNFDAQGNLYGCSGGGRRILRFEPDGSATPLPHLLDGRRHNRPNDLAIDRKGRIWFTDPSGQIPADERELDHASVLRLDPDPAAQGGWTLQRMTFDTFAPNGLLFSQTNALSTWCKATTRGPATYGPIRYRTTTPWAGSPCCTSSAKTTGASTEDSTACASIRKGTLSPQEVGGRRDRGR